MIAEVGTQQAARDESATGACCACDSLADRLLSFVAMSGTIGGAIGGALVGADLDTAFPEKFGMLGILLGCGCAVGGWWLLSRLWPSHTAHEPGHGTVAAYPGVQCRVR